MIITTLKDGTVINMKYVVLVEPLRGSGQYASYEVRLTNRKESIGIFENDVSRETFLSTLQTVSN